MANIVYVNLISLLKTDNQQSRCSCQYIHSLLHSSLYNNLHMCVSLLYSLLCVGSPMCNAWVKHYRLFLLRSHSYKCGGVAGLPSDDYSSSANMNSLCQFQPHVELQSPQFYLTAIGNGGQVSESVTICSWSLYSTSYLFTLACQVFLSVFMCVHVQSSCNDETRC